jgi:rhomboid protease GluP
MPASARPEVSGDASPGDDDLIAALTTEGPLARGMALRLLDRAAGLHGSGEFAAAAGLYRRVMGFDDAAVTAAAWLGFGEAMYRLDEEPAAVAAWETVLQLPETPSTYPAWRNVAAARVRAGDLGGARRAYQEADRRAPADDRAEIASRLGWLARELGDAGAARRYFARSRGDGPALPWSWIVIGATVLASVAGFTQDGASVIRALALDKSALADGELYRLLSVTLVHGNLLHLFFNMYALYLLGPLTEQIWGSRLFALFYVLTAAAASTASFVVSDGTSVGASGAVFGLVGVLMAGTRAHNPILDRRARQIVPQLGTIVLVNLAFGFLAGGMIDNAAHVGGLVAGLWLGVVVPPGRAPTLQSLWQQPRAGEQGRRSPLLVTACVLLLVAATVVGLAVGGVQLA